MKTSGNPKIDSAELIQMVTDLVLEKIGNQSVKPESHDSVTLTVGQKVVTTGNLPSNWKHAKEIAFLPSAVVTPAVLDLLRDKGIGYRFGNDQKKPKSQTASASSSRIPQASDTAANARGTIVVDREDVSGFAWLQKLSTSFGLNLQSTNDQQIPTGKCLILSDNPFEIQRRFAESQNIHAIVGCKSFSETFDRMAYSRILILPASTTSWNVRQVLKGWDQIGSLVSVQTKTEGKGK